MLCRFMLFFCVCVMQILAWTLKRGPLHSVQHIVQFQNRRQFNLLQLDDIVLVGDAERLDVTLIHGEVVVGFLIVCTPSVFFV